MSKSINESSPIFKRYKDQWDKNPQTKIFAPLADCYRKMNNYKEAFKILKIGLKHDPNNQLGQMVLANCYFDKKNYEVAYEILNKIIEKNLYNFQMQNLFAQVCLNLNLKEKALQQFKYLLYLRPMDNQIQSYVKNLEKELDRDWENKLDLSDVLNLRSNNENALEEIDVQTWHIDDSLQEKVERKNSFDENNDENWFVEEVYNSKSITLNEEKLEGRDKVAQLDSKLDFSLADLYIKKDLYKQALNVLESFQKLHPDSSLVSQKLLAVKKLVREKEMVKSKINDIEIGQVGAASEKILYLQKLKKHFEQSFDSNLKNIV